MNELVVGSFSSNEGLLDISVSLKHLNMYEAH